MITQSELHQVLDYNQDTGIFVWKVSPRNNVPVGTIAGYTNKDGYVRISLNNRLYLAHSLAWLYCFGEMPAMLDHTDRNPNNNRIKNLRLTNKSLNAQNAKLRSDNALGCRGVCKIRNRFYARICLNSVAYPLGSFATLAEAKMVRDAVASILHMHATDV